MNEFNHPASTSDLPWSPSEPQLQGSDTSLPRGNEQAAPPAVGLLRNAVLGAHGTVDRFAESAEPAVRQMGESVSDAADSLHAKADHWRETRDEWIAGARKTVRGHPLVSVAAALALGAVIARITR